MDLNNEFSGSLCLPCYVRNKKKIKIIRCNNSKKYSLYHSFSISQIKIPAQYKYLFNSVNFIIKININYIQYALYTDQLQLHNGVQLYNVLFFFASRCIPHTSGRWNLVLRQFPHFPPNSGIIVCLVAELNAALCHNRHEYIKYFRPSTVNRTHNLSRLQSYPFTPPQVFFQHIIS